MIARSPSLTEQVKQHAANSKVNLLGVCQGGVLSLCYSCLHPAKVKNLITLVTPVDFHTCDNVLAALARQIDAQQVLDEAITKIRPESRASAHAACLQMMGKNDEAERILGADPDLEAEANRGAREALELRAGVEAYGAESG